ncbi:20682_t:CDS:1, partial [Gigaspora rosea]
MQYPTISNIKRSSNHEACTSSEYEPFKVMGLPNVTIPDIHIVCENSGNISEGCNRDGFDIC